MKTFFYIFAIIGFFAGALVHSLTFFGVNAQNYVPGIWVLHLGIFVAMIPVIRKDLWRKVFLPPRPRSVKLLTGAFMAYALINFALFIFLSHGGWVAIEDGKYMFHSKAYSAAYEISEAEYRQQKTYELRGFSGHWMLFYFFPILYSRYREGGPFPNVQDSTSG